MKSINILIFSFVLVAYLSVASAGPFDNVNVDNLLRNPIVVQRQIRCLQCQGPCDRIGNELKRVLPRVAATNCGDCSVNERLNMGKVMSHVQQNYPQEWSQLNYQMKSGRKC